MSPVSIEMKCESNAANPSPQRRCPLPYWRGQWLAHGLKGRQKPRMDQRHAKICRDAEWLAYRYQLDRDLIHFRPIPRDLHRKTTFLTDEYLGEAKEIVALDRREAVAGAGELAPLHFIFHSAFCCSTVLARAFDISGVSMGLKEPVILNDLVGIRHRREAGPQELAERIQHCLTLLARPFAPGEAVIIKPSNIVNGIAGALMGLFPTSKALFLHAPLETYLKSIVKKGMDGRLWARDLLARQMLEGSIDLGFTDQDYLRLTDIQAAAVGWLAQHAMFARHGAKLGPARLMTLDSETLMAKPAEAMTTLAAHFGLSLSQAQVAEIVAGPAFTSHSKSGAQFGAQERTAEYDAAAELHADELAKVMVWARAVAESAGLRI
jgi:hypothetical protein